MARYVDAEGIPELFDEEFKKTRKLISKGETHLDNLAEGFTEADRVIRKIPTADVQEVVHAKWEISSNGYYPYCSNCKNEPESGVMSNYCPECGAKMDRGDVVMSDDKKQTPRGIDTADLVEVVRCKDCKHYDDGECTFLSESGRIYERWTVDMDEVDYCSCGERRDT